MTQKMKALDILSTLTVLGILLVAGMLFVFSSLTSKANRASPTEAAASEISDVYGELERVPPATDQLLVKVSEEELTAEAATYSPQPEKRRKAPTDPLPESPPERLVVQQEELIHALDAIRAYLQDEQAVRNGKLEEADRQKLDEYLEEDLPESVYHQQQQRQE